MNKTNLVIEAILAIFVVLLMVDRFSGKEGKESNEKSKIEVVEDKQSLNIAYINVDSLLVNYEKAIQMNKKFADKQRQSQRELEKRMAKFQKNYQAFQEKAQRGGFLTEASAKAQQEELISEQQQLEKLNSDLSTELMAEEQKLNQELYKTISQFVLEYNKDKKYDLILSNTMAGTVLYGLPKMNITHEVLQALNARHQAQGQIK